MAGVLILVDTIISIMYTSCVFGGDTAVTPHRIIPAKPSAKVVE
jgi:hypothetical protein